MGRSILVVVCALTAALLAAPRAGAAPGDRPPGVVVQFATGGARAERAGSPAPSLSDQGFRTLAIPAGMTRDEFLSQLRGRPDVISAEPDAEVFGAMTPDDPFYPQNQTPYLNYIGTPQAWDIATGRGDRPVVIAVIDSGTDLDHEDLQGRLWENTLETPGDGIDNDGNGCVDDRYGCRFIDQTAQRAAACGYTNSFPDGNVRDDDGQPGSLSHSHGTLVAGTAAAAGNNGIGITGVAWDARIMTVKVLDCGPNGTGPRGEMSKVAMGIDYARRMGANVINLSLASAPGDATADQLALRTAIQEARDQGILVVAAAGNHDIGATQTGVGYPAAYTQFDNMIAVGSSDNSGHWSATSNYGAAIDFAAPGENIASTARSDLGFAQPYRVASGTSFSAPLVAGMFALMMTRNSRLAYGEYVNIARAAAMTALPAPHGGNWAGSGIINIGTALAGVPMTISGSALHDWMDVPAGSDMKAFGPIARYVIRIRAQAEQQGCGAPGRTVQLLVEGLPANPTFTWGGQNADLGIVNVDVTSVSPPPGPVVVQALGAGWNQIAWLDGGGELPGALQGLSAAWDQVYVYDPEKEFLGGLGGYRHWFKNVPEYVNDFPFLDRYDAIWVNATSANVASPNPNPPSGRAIFLHRGWNNFVYTGAAGAVADVMADVAGDYTAVLQWDNLAQDWRSYYPDAQRYENDFGGMFKLQVYWVYMSSPGTLVMN